jgi:DNA invertase Pin-like site-specific DNA recombinase
MENYISYCRVSTTKQGISGLGLDAQRAAIAKHVGNSGRVLKEYVEIESGRKCTRPQIHRAIAECRLTKATLLIAKLDRLARNVAFTSTLIESGVRVVACDMPDADPFRLHIEAAIAEEEARKISSRTKAALAVAKARGVTLGGWRGKLPSAEQLKTIREQRTTLADERAGLVWTVIDELQAERGPMSLRQIAKALNERRVATARGSMWTPTTVRRVIQRAA